LAWQLKKKLSTAIGAIVSELNIIQRLGRYLLGEAAIQKLGSVSSQVDDSTGWSSLLHRGHDRDSAEVQEMYEDALKAWRKNPFAKRYIEATTDYVVGDSIKLSSEVESLQEFMTAFWNHPKNLIDLRLESMCEELTRAGDLFPALFRNDEDGMSYIRFVTKDDVVKIETQKNDWETENYYYQKEGLKEPKKWFSKNKATSKTKAIMLHYSINRPIGALLGESDLASIIPW